MISVVVQKGRSANLMKVGTKRKRTKKEIAEDKQEEIAKEVEATANIAELSRLKEKVRKLESESKKGKQATSIVNQMVGAGMVIQDGEDSIILNGNEGAQQRIQAEPIDEDELIGDVEFQWAPVLGKEQDQSKYVIQR